jgi:hypothetical protein
LTIQQVGLNLELVLTAKPILEKKSVRFTVRCTPSESIQWAAVFGPGEVSHKARELLNKETKRKLFTK